MSRDRKCTQCAPAAVAGIAHICDGIMEARAERAEALAVLRAIGEAIATVARATMIVRVSSGSSVGIEFRDGRVIELRPRFDRSQVCEYDSVRERYFQDGRCLREFVGAPSDVAAEAVAALIEERARVYAETAR